MNLFQPGQMVGPYQIVQQIGQGGMATVYRAYHIAMDRTVAIKVLPYQFASNPEFLGRFQQEVRLIARLEHPHILPVYDSGEHQGIPYLVMRFLEAGTLKERIQAQKLSLTEVNRLFTQLADALHYAHEQGVIHRDIKPSNAMIDKRGDLFLTDFGIAKLIEGSAQFTATGAITGTPAYMSPEQAQGQPLDVRSDVYSLGIVLYEMLTGRVPFEAETPLAVILKHIQEPLPPPSLHVAGLPPAIEVVLLKALAKNPEQRFESVAEFLQAWQNALTQPEMVTLPRAAIPLENAAPSSAPVSIPKETQTGPTAPPTPIEPPPPTGSPRFRPSLKQFIIGSVTLLTIAFLCLGSLFFVNRIFENKRGTPGAPPMPPRLGEQNWQSWSGGRTILGLQPYGSRIAAYGIGGIRLWQPENGSIETITTQNGLPSNIVLDLLIDGSEVWIATTEGLGYYDGANWVVYHTEDGLGSNLVSALAWFDDETIWIGTQYSWEPGSGLMQLTFENEILLQPIDFPSTNEENPNPAQVSTNINDILAADDGMFVATWDGLAVWQEDTGWLVYHQDEGLPDNHVNVLMEDNIGRVWVGTNAGLAVWEDGELWRPRDLSELGLYNVYGLLQADDGIFWIAGSGGLVRYDEAAADWQMFNMSNSNLTAYTLFGALQTEDGRLFFGTDSEGFVEFENGMFVTHRIENTPRAAAFGRILEDPQGNLWFVEEWGGIVDMLEPSRLRWHPEPQHIFGDECCPIALAWDQHGQLWAGGETGLWIFSKHAAPVHLTTQAGLPSDSVQQVAFTPDGRTAWIGMNGGAASIENEQIVESYTASDALPLFTNTALYVSADGSVWFGGDNVVLQRLPDGAWQSFDDQWRVYTPEDGLPEDMGAVTGFAEDTQNRLWMVTNGSGAFRLENGGWLPVEDVPTWDFTGIWRAPDNSLWFGTYENGAYRWRDGVWDVFSTAQGLIDPRVNFIWVDRSGTIWFATGGGVSRYQP